jgi:hypothetical protein
MQNNKTLQTRPTQHIVSNQNYRDINALMTFQSQICVYPYKREAMNVMYVVHYDKSATYIGKTGCLAKVVPVPSVPCG